jgi:hypothetical protein
MGADMAQPVLQRSLPAWPTCGRSSRSPCRRRTAARQTYAAGPAPPSPGRARPSHTRPETSSDMPSPSGVPAAVVNTRPVSCQRDPAASRIAVWSACHARSASTAICASCSARRDLGVFSVSPGPDPRSTATKEGRRPGRHPAPSRSPGPPRGARPPSGLPRCRRASARPDAANPSTLRAAPVPLVPAVGAARSGGRSGCCKGRRPPSPVREHAPVVPGCGSWVSD